MLIRQAFITNSSSTSFIAYGVRVSLQDCFPELDEETEGESWEEMWALADPYYEKVEKMQTKEVGIHSGDCWEDFPNGSLFIGINESWEDFGDGAGFIPIDPSALAEHDTKKWDQLLYKFCEKYNIKLFGSEPKWIFAANVAR
jgi:hypothetical protein